MKRRSDIMEPTRAKASRGREQPSRSRIVIGVFVPTVKGFWAFM
jgi:hypothetical protein